MRVQDVRRDSSRHDLPGILDDDAQVLPLGELDCGLHVADRASIDSDHRDAPLIARDSEGRIKEACVDSAVGELERLEVGLLHLPGHFSAPDPIVPILLDFGAVPRGVRGRVARGCGR
jgi:hypothetical protein